MAEAQAPTQQGNDAPPQASSGQSDDAPRFPTFTDIKIAGERVPLFSEAYRRLIWPLQGEFPSAISVMEQGDQRNPGHVEPLFNPETDEWHEIASKSITSREVSGLEASLTDLDSWDRTWQREHEEHADPARDGCEYVTYGDLDNDVRPWAVEPEREDGTWSWDERSDREILVRCCGQERPLDKVGLTLEVRLSPGNDFVTVKDYVGAVHAWLMGMRDDIIGAMWTAEPGYPDSTEWRLSTDYSDGPAHRIMLPEEWNRPIPTMSISPEENDRILEMLHPELFVGLAPGARVTIPPIGPTFAPP